MLENNISWFLIQKKLYKQLLKKMHGGGGKDSTSSSSDAVPAASPDAPMGPSDGPVVGEAPILDIQVTVVVHQSIFFPSFRSSWDFYPTTSEWLNKESFFTRFLFYKQHFYKQR